MFLEYKNYSINVEFLLKEHPAISLLIIYEKEKKHFAGRRRTRRRQMGRGGSEMKMEVSNDVRNSLVWIDPCRDFECTSWKARLHLFQRVGGRKGCICMLPICDSRSLEKVVGKAKFLSGEFLEEIFLPFLLFFYGLSLVIKLKRDSFYFIFYLHI